MIAALGVVVTLALAWAPASLKAEPPPRADALQSVLYANDSRPVRRLIVKFKDDAPSEESERRAIPTGKARAAALNVAGFHTPGSRKPARLAFLKSISQQSHVMVSDAPMARSDMAALARTIAQDPRVAYAEIDERVYPLAFTPDDPGYASQWNMKSPDTSENEKAGANLSNAWSRSVAGQPVNGSGVTVAVLDTGYRPHADVAANIVAGYDFVSEDSNATFTTANDGDGRDSNALDPGDWNTNAASCDVSNSTWHGTRVAGIIGAVGNNGTGIIGAAYGATLLPVRVLGVCGGYISDIAAGIQWAAGLAVPGVPANTAHIAKVINLSIGATGACSPTFQNAITAAYNAGSTIAVATGNDSSGSISSPANCTGVIAVTAHTRAGDRLSVANIGLGTSISAPGGTGNGDGNYDIYSTSNAGSTTPSLLDDYGTRYGTSFAAPHVSGVAALLLQIRPTLSPAAVLNYLRSTARAFPAGSYCDGRTDCGAGMLDAFKAVDALMTAQGTPNHAPVLVAMPTQTVAAGSSLQFTVTATDADGDRVTFRVSGLPSGATFDAGAGTFSWNYALPGTYYVKITPNDGLTDGTIQTVVVSVTGALPSSGGGGGGSMGVLDIVAVLLLALATWALRRYAPRQPPPHKNC